MLLSNLAIVFAVGGASATATPKPSFDLRYGGPVRPDSCGTGGPTGCGGLRPRLAFFQIVTRVVVTDPDKVAVCWKPVTSTLQSELGVLLGRVELVPTVGCSHGFRAPIESPLRS